MGKYGEIEGIIFIDEMAERIGDLYSNSVNLKTAPESL